MSAKGLNQHKERQALVDSFGKDLVRRARSSCELCEASGVKLKVFEVAPVPKEPDFDRCILICDTCREQIEQPKRVDADHWRCLNTAAWSEVPPVQVQAVLMLNRLLAKNDWATDLHDMLYLDPEVEAWITAAETAK